MSNETSPYLKDKLHRHHSQNNNNNNNDDDDDDDDNDDDNNNNTFHEISSSRYMNSFFPGAITSWNNVINHFDNIPSINILKDHILSLIRPKGKNIFGIHDPLGLRYLTQLRVGLSFLRCHKNVITLLIPLCLCNNVITLLIPLCLCNNVITLLIPLCLCNNGIEDTSHFLFSSPFFSLLKDP